MRLRAMVMARRKSCNTIGTMNRLILIFVMLLLPLQASWAAVTEYCMHETGAATQHFGHHFHKHHASAGDSSGDSSRGIAGTDKDCGMCHISINLIPSTASMPSLEICPQADGVPRQDGYSSFVSRGPERPNWASFA